MYYGCRSVGYLQGGPIHQMLKQESALNKNHGPQRRLFLTVRVRHAHLELVGPPSTQAPSSPAALHLPRSRRGVLLDDDLLNVGGLETDGDEQAARRAEVQEDLRMTVTVGKPHKT